VILRKFIAKLKGIDSFYAEFESNFKRAFIFFYHYDIKERNSSEAL
jgi:hypothetical protein